jgi:mannose-1-phosphate guanylyltransferase/phosphomannomutase
LTRVANPLQFGVVITRVDGKITRFLEKPTWGEVFSDTINTGIYILEPEVLDLIPAGEEFDFSKNLFPMMLDRGMPLYGHISKGYWRDIGNLNEYQDAHLDILRNAVRLPLEGKKSYNAYVGEGTTVDTTPDTISGIVVIGKNSKIHRDVVLSNSVIGDHCELKPGTVVRNSVLWDGVSVGVNAEILSAVVGFNTRVGDHARIAENVFVGDHCSIGKSATLFSNIKLWPEKSVEDGATVTRSLVWEDRWLRELFTNSRVTGISNVDMNSEFGAKLGAAFGALVGPGATVITSRDSDNVSRMINRALICGLMSSGVHCSDLRATSIPIVRYELKVGKERGGFHVRKSPFDKNLTDIIFFNADGKDLPSNKTKAVDRLFYGEDFARAPHESVGTVAFPERVTESYVSRFLETLKIQDIRSAGLKTVIDYSNGVASTIFPNILGSLNVQVVSLNAYLDKSRLTRTKEEFEQSVRELSFVVTHLKYDIGCMLDAGAEKLSVVDENGVMIPGDRLLTLMTKLVKMVHPELDAVAVPVSATGEIDLLADSMGFSVVRTPDSHLALMDAASKQNMQFVGGTKGGFVFNGFLFASDGMYSVAKLLEFMAITGKRLGELDRETVRLHLVKDNVPCSWHVKGRIMRRLLKETEMERRELIEGIKLHVGKPDGYTSVLLRPDPARAVFHVNAESPEKSVAEELSDEYIRKIRTWIESEV